jgi:hypothetical protein
MDAVGIPVWGCCGIILSTEAEHSICGGRGGGNNNSRWS